MSTDFVGKEFDFCEAELDSLALREQRADAMEEQAHSLYEQSKQERRTARALVVAWAKKRAGVPDELPVKPVLDAEGRPKGFVVVEKPKTPCEGKDCGDKPPIKLSEAQPSPVTA